MSQKYRILFVCMGNICRSPAAHGVMEKLVYREGLADRVEIDSAGTGAWHSGNLPDPRMRRHAARRGYDLTSRARQIKSSDFRDFDLILVMDQQNLRDLQNFTQTPDDLRNVKLFCDFVKNRSETEVPDPYYGGDEGFETVLDLVENGCREILHTIRR